MKLKIVIVIICVFILTMFRCSVKTEDLSGVYILELNDVREVLVLKKNFTYNRKIYNNESGKKLFEFSGKWGKETEGIVLKNFSGCFTNTFLYEKYFNGGKVPDWLIDTSLNVKTTFLGNIYIEVTEFGEVYAKYKKL